MFCPYIIIPLVKNKLADLRSVDTYRAITLIPVISKLFECILLKICADYFKSDDLQFGFKQAVGCANALFAMRSSIDFLLTGAALYSQQLWTLVRHMIMLIFISCIPT